MEGHTVRRYDGELNSLHLKTLEMATLVRGQLRDVIAALLERAPAKAVSVEERDSEVDRLQVRLDEEVASVIARRGPMAQDLRTILAISKAVTDLERVGDESVRIAELCHTMCDPERSPPGEQLLRDVGSMGRLALEQLNHALTALDQLNTEEAALLLGKNEMELEFQATFRRMATYIMEDHRNLGHAINVVLVCKALERIGDHARNIAAYVVFMVTGKDVRHRGGRAPEAQSGGAA